MALTKVSSQMIDGVGSGGQNYITSNPDAESSVFGWATYADGAAIPVDGTGGSPTGTLTRSTSSPLRGVGSFLYTAGALGNGTSFAFTIDPADQAKLLQVSFNWAPSATLADGDYTVYVYDVTNAVMSQVIPYKIGGGLSTGQYAFKGSFQSASNSTSYRLVINQAVATPAGNLKFDNVYVGVQPVSYTCPTSDWIAYTPTFTGLGTPTGVSFAWQRVGDTLFVKGSLTTGTTSATPISITLPFGISVDATKMSIANTTSQNGEQIGWFASLAAGAFGSIVTATGTSTSVVYVGTNSTAINNFLTPTNGNSALGGTGNFVSFMFRVPIVGWSSSAAISQTDSSEGRIVSAFYGGTPTGTLSAAYNPVTYPTKFVDTHGGMSGSSYTVKVTGYYDISAQIALTGTFTGTTGNLNFAMAVNGTNKYQNLATANATYGYATNSINLKSYPLTAGDVVDVRSYVPNGTGLAFETSGTENFFSIAKVSGNQSVMASESVNMRYALASATITGTLSAVTFTTKAFDSHNAYSGSTFTVPSAGKYQVNATTVVAGTYTLNQVTELHIYKNGTTYSRNLAYAGGAISGQFITCADIVSCVAGDTIQIYCSSAATSPAVFNDSDSKLSISRVGN